MYNSFFSLRESPFNVNVDPRFFFPTAQTGEALQRLAYGIQNRKGLILLTGEVGTGKTMMLNQLLDWLRQLRTPTAFVFNSNLGEGDLFNLMACDFGITTQPNDTTNLPIRLNRWLLDSYRARVTPVLIVDEAQGLSFERLEEIRLLLNIETACEKMLQIVFAGQPELEDRLNQPEGRQIRQRIAVRCKINPLTLEQTHGYIEQRLRIAGATGEPIFQCQAMDAVYSYSRGIPRLINLICEHSLINAYVDQLRPVPARTVEAVAEEFQLDEVYSSFVPLASSSPTAISAVMQLAVDAARKQRPASAEQIETQRAHAAVAGGSCRFPAVSPNGPPAPMFSDTQAFSSTPAISVAPVSPGIPLTSTPVSPNLHRSHWPLVLPASAPVQQVSALAIAPRSSTSTAAATPRDTTRPVPQVQSVHDRQRHWVHPHTARRTLRDWWSARRDECLSLVNAPALRRVTSSFLQWLSTPRHRTRQTVENRHWQNVHLRRSSASVPLHRYWLSALDRFAASFVERVRQGKLGFFRWLQQPLHSPHRR